jgi:formate dehydrogenase iron-sulfur subunit
MGKMFFVDLTRCTACRGCQIACKQWKNLPAEKTVNNGSHQNPPDLSGVTIRLVRFKETVNKDGKPGWNFFPEQCRHCLDAPCKAQADTDNESAIFQDAVTGAVVCMADSAKVDFDGVRAACPYDVPRKNEETGLIVKCDMCFDRIGQDLLPACVLSCPTGCMHFGEEGAMLELARARLAEAKKEWPAASLGDADSVRVIYLFKEQPDDYFEHAVADASRGIPVHASAQASRRNLLRRALRV